MIPRPVPDCPEAALHDLRPRVHLTPPGNWLNDPNGLFYRDGRLHVTYQYNPVEPRWGQMHWGHAVSDDLLTWRHLPIALSPDPNGPDTFGCWSGCVVDAGPEAVLFYTGVVLQGDLRRQAICRATSRDPVRTGWTKDDANPLIPEPPPGIDPELFRDPFVFRADDGWTMLVGAGTDRGEGAVLRYVSADLRRWEHAGPILVADELDPVLGADGPMWECPQLLSFGETDVLIVSVVDRAPGIRPSHVMAFVGRLRGGRFEVRRGQQLGMGPDFYAPASARTPDGRWLLLGWIPEDPPGPGEQRTWAGALTLPRIVSLRPDGWLSLALAAEVAGVGSPAVAGPLVLSTDSEPWTRAIPDEPFELRAEIEPAAGSEVVLELRDDDPADPIARIAYRADERLLSVARRGIVNVAGRSARSATTLPASDGGDLHLRLIVDGSVLELETNGHTMATMRLTAHGSGGPTVTLGVAAGQARVRSLEIGSLGPR